MKHIHQDFIDWLRSKHFQVKIETKKTNSDFWAVKYGETLLSYIDGKFNTTDYNEMMDCLTHFELVYNEYEDFTQLEEVHNHIKEVVSRYDEWQFYRTELGRKVRNSLDAIKKDFK